MTRRFTLLLALGCCVAVLGVTGCGSSSSSSSALSPSVSTASTSTGATHLAKTKFLIHAGLGFGAFHRWIYRPVKAGYLKHPFSHKLALIKAGLASLFVYHELKLAAQDVRSSKLLSALFSPLTAAADKVKSLKSSLTGGTTNGSDVEGLNSQLGQIANTAAAHGQSITESVPSASQLATNSGA
jgi:hypothetical protein